jgi:hypothetical protein
LGISAALVRGLLAALPQDRTAANAPAAAIDQEDGLLRLM